MKPRRRSAARGVERMLQGSCRVSTRSTFNLGFASHVMSSSGSSGRIFRNNDLVRPTATLWYSALQLHSVAAAVNPTYSYMSSSTPLDRYMVMTLFLPLITAAEIC